MHHSFTAWNRQWGKRNVKYCKSKDQDCFDYYIDEGSNAVITSYTCGATDYVMDDPDNNIGHYVYDENSISNVKIPSNIIADNARFTVSTLEEWSFGDAGVQGQARRLFIP